MWNAFVDFFAGLVGGVTGLIIGYPGDTVKVRQQAVGGTITENIRYTWRHEGLLGFYRGLTAPLFIIGPSNAVFFGIYGACLRVFDPNSKERVDLNNPHWKRDCFVAGGIAGFFQVFITCPVELLKTVMQTSQGISHNQGGYPHFKSTREAAIYIYNIRGIRGIYKGFIPNLWRDVPNSAVYTLVYERTIPRGEKYSLSQQILAGGLAGVASWTSTLPFDVIKSRLQSDSQINPVYKGMIDCAIKSYKAEGLKVFGKGFLLISLRAFPVNAAMCYGYEECLRLMKT